MDITTVWNECKRTYSLLNTQNHNRTKLTESHLCAESIMRRINNAPNRLRRITLNRFCTCMYGRDMCGRAWVCRIDSASNHLRRINSAPNRLRRIDSALNRLRRIVCAESRRITPNRFCAESFLCRIDSARYSSFYGQFIVDYPPAMSHKRHLHCV